jgi:hypothetical protein
MAMRKPSGVKVGDLAVLAGTVGLVEKSPDGEDAFLAWWNQDQKGARAALFSRVSARRAAAAAAAPKGAPRSMTAAEAQAGRSGEPTDYPAWMGRPKAGAAASVRRAVATGQQQVVVAPQYPPGWLAAAGQARRNDGVQIVEVND